MGLPENVVRARPDHGPPVVKILDFGIAKVRPLDTASDRLTKTGTVVGTLGYMSPEQLRGLEVDRRRDLFAVGVMVAEALTGRWPFEGGPTVSSWRPSSWSRTTCLVRMQRPVHSTPYCSGVWQKSPGVAS